MKTLTLSNGRKVGRQDRVYSDLDGRWVRISRIEADGFVEVCDGESGRVLPDLCNPTQLR